MGCSRLGVKTTELVCAYIFWFPHQPQRCQHLPQAHHHFMLHHALSGMWNSRCPLQVCQVKTTPPDVGPTRNHMKSQLAFPGKGESTNLKFRFDKIVPFIGPQRWWSVTSRLDGSTGWVKSCLVLKFLQEFLSILQEVSPTDLSDNNFKEENRATLYDFFGLWCEVFYSLFVCFAFLLAM